MTRCDALEPGVLAALMGRFGLDLVEVAEGEPLPGSYWGEPEAGLVGGALYVSDATPVHSALHEACHYVCMDSRRRAGLDTDAGGGYDEENAVCYLSILLSRLVPGLGEARMLEDMDAWGYTFRLGSSRAWFERDAHEVREWLEGAELVRADGSPTWRLHDAA